MELVKVEHLNKSFVVGGETVEVLKDINLTIEKGTFVIIFGPSGCGKSTLLHSILGLEKPTEGRVMMEGSDFYDMDDDERALFRRHKIGVVYQQPLWVKSFNVLENVSFPLHLLREERSGIKDKAVKMLAEMKMENWANNMPTELSSGQQQKVSLARSLMNDPLLLVADEPTGNLDTVSGKEILDIFLKLVESGKTILMVTHDLNYLKYGDKIVHILDGRIVGEANPKKMSDNSAFVEETKNVRDPNFIKNMMEGKSVSVEVGDEKEKVVKKTVSKKTEKGGSNG